MFLVNTFPVKILPAQLSLISILFSALFLTACGAGKTRDMVILPEQPIATTPSSSSSSSSTSSIISSSSSSESSSVGESSAANSSSAPSEPEPTCDTDAINEGRSLYAQKGCVGCHGAFDENTGTVPGVVPNSIFDVRNLQQPAALENLKQYIIDSMMNSLQGCQGDATCEAEGARITAYLESPLNPACNNSSALKLESTFEYVASAEDFAGYKTWTSLTPTQNDAHINQTFYNAIAVNSTTAEYDIGSIIVREAFVTQGTNTNNAAASQQEAKHQNTLVAMVKRGGSFNSENNGWEWFVIEPEDLAVLARGANIDEQNSCNECHSQAEIIASGVDYTFSPINGSHSLEDVKNEDALSGNPINDDRETPHQNIDCTDWQQLTSVSGAGLTSHGASLQAGNTKMCFQF